VLEFGDPNVVKAILTCADTVEEDGYQQLAADLRYGMAEHHPDLHASFFVSQARLKEQCEQMKGDLTDIRKMVEDMKEHDAKQKAKIFDLERQVSGKQIQLDRATARINHYRDFIREEIHTNGG
jgi:SMC interacting uncharacterized protein involved in chromosome segregation